MFIGSEQGVALQYTTRALGHMSWISFTLRPVTVGFPCRYKFFACGSIGGRAGPGVWGRVRGGTRRNGEYPTLNSDSPRKTHRVFVRVVAASVPLGPRFGTGCATSLPPPFSGRKREKHVTTTSTDSRATGVSKWKPPAQLHVRDL